MKSDRAIINHLLLHRDPFLFVKSLSIEDGLIIGQQSFNEDSAFFKGHFPDNPIVPGVLIVESMVQCGGAGAKLILGQSASLFKLISINKASFHRIVLPNQEIRIEIKNISIDNNLINQSGKAYVNGELVAKAEWICYSEKKQ